MRKLIFIFVLSMMLGGSTSKSQIVDTEEKIQPIKKSNVIILRVRGDYGEVIMTQEI